MDYHRWRWVLMLAVVAVTALGLTVATAHSASAQLACFGQGEDFDGGAFPPTGWSEVDDYGSGYHWQTNSWWGEGNYAGTGTAATFASYPSCFGAFDNWLITPPIDLTGMRAASFDFRGNYHSFSSDYLDVDVSTDGGGSWTNELHWTGSHGTLYGSNSGVATSVDLTAYRGNSNVLVRFRHASPYGCEWYAQVDDVGLTCAVDAAAVEELPVTFAEPQDEVCYSGVATIQVEVENIGTATLADIPGQPEFSATVRTIGGMAQVLSISSGSVGAGQVPGSGPLGGSATADLNIPVGGTDIVTLRVGFPGGVGSVSGIYVDRKVWVDSTPQDGIIDQGELYEFEMEEPIEIPCAPTIAPNSQLGMQVHLPILNYIGNDDRCNTWIEVQNVGPVPVKAVLVTWGEPGFCPPQAAGPLKVECTGLLKPGSTWNMITDQIPTGSKSGMLFKFSTDQLSDHGLDVVFGFDDILADLMCETLFFGVVGDADDWRRFKKAYNEGGSFAGIPQDIASGAEDGGILAVDVLRDCPGDVTAGVRVTSKYNGIAGNHLGMYDPVYGGYAYYVPLVYADRAEFNSWIYIQNGGLECSSVEIWMQAQDDCLRARICDVSTLAPGETIQFDPNDCVSQGWQGSAWVRTSQPMGIAVDIVGRDTLMTYVGEAAELNYTFDPESATFTGGNQVAFGPLMYSEYQGWDSGVQVQNLSPVVAAKVKVYFLDRSGDVITTLVDWICPRGSQTFFLPVVADLPGNWVGSIRVESQEWITPGGPRIAPPNIVAVATLIKYSDAQRTETREAIAYNLLPEHKIFDWQIGYGGGGLESGVGLIAIPSLLSDLQGTGVTSEIAIANVVPKPGFTDFAIFIYDQNGLLDYICQKLNEKQVEYIDINTWGYINNGFKGSAIISAFFWEHEVFAGDGRFLRNLVGLGAVAVERSKTSLGTDVAGDEAAGARGIPFMESEDFEFGFMAEPIICPGLPDRRFREGPGGGGAAWVCPPDAVSGTLGGNVNWPDYDSGTHGTRIYRDGVASACAPPKTCPGGNYAGGGNAQAVYFDNPDGKEVCVTVTSGQGTCWTGYNAHPSAFTGRYPVNTAWTCDPEPGVTYLGDSGGSPAGPGESFGFTIPSGTDEWTLLVTNVFGAVTCDWEFEISGFDCQ